MDPTDAWKYCMYNNPHTFNNRDIRVYDHLVAHSMNRISLKKFEFSNKEYLRYVVLLRNIEQGYITKIENLEKDLL